MVGCVAAKSGALSGRGLRMARAIIAIATRVAVSNAAVGGVLFIGDLPRPMANLVGSLALGFKTRRTGDRRAIQLPGSPVFRPFGVNMRGSAVQHSTRSQERRGVRLYPL